MGLVVAGFGVLLAWVGHREGNRDLLAIALVMAGSGVWIAGLHRLVRSRTPGLAIGGGLFVGWGVAGGVAAAQNRFWIGALVCAALLFVGLLLLGVVPLPAWAQRAVTVLRKRGPGLALMGAGLFITGQGLAGGASEGVPPFVLVAAGLVFLLAGVLVALHERRGQDTVLSRILVALLVTGLASTAIVFPPGLLLAAPIVVLSWIAVVRLVVEKWTGSDPLAKWSEERVLGLGVGVTLAIGFVIFGMLQLRSCLRPPEAGSPAEAVGAAAPTQRIAIGRPGEPVAPLNRTGVKMNRNS